MNGLRIDQKGIYEIILNAVSTRLHADPTFRLRLSNNQPFTSIHSTKQYTQSSRQLLRSFNVLIWNFSDCSQRATLVPRQPYHTISASFNTQSTDPRWSRWYCSSMCIHASSSLASHPLLFSALIDLEFWAASATSCHRLFSLALLSWLFEQRLHAAAFLSQISRSYYWNPRLDFCRHQRPRRSLIAFLKSLAAELVSSAFG